MPNVVEEKSLKISMIKIQSDLYQPILVLQNLVCTPKNFTNTELFISADLISMYQCQV